MHRREMKTIEYPEALADCRACPLADMGAPVGGDYRAANWDILVVMRNPGETERDKGFPAIGKTGMFLRRFLAQAGILQRCAITNVVKHYTPSNRPPTDQEIKACSHWLEQEMAEHGGRVKLVLCVGFEAAKWAGGFKGAIGKHVGSTRRSSRILQDVPAYAVYHPSYLYRMRGKPEYRQLERQMRNCLAEVAKLADEGHHIPAYEYVRADDLSAAGSYALDTEYAGGEDERTSRIMLVSLHDGRTTYVSPHIQKVEGNPIFWHAQADLVAMMSNGIDVRPTVVEDAMVKAWMLGETDLRLKYQAHKYLGITTITYDELKEQGGWDNWLNYSAQDAALTWPLNELYTPRINSVAGVRWCYENINAPLQMILARMSCTGIPINKTLLLTKMAIAERTMERLSETIKLMAGWDINPNSNEQVAVWLYDELGLKRPRMRPDAKHPPTDAPTLKKLRHRAADLILAYRHVEDLLSRYLRPISLLDSLSGLWKITGTETSRLSCEKRNLMNLPSDVDALLVPPQGMVFVSGDYKGMELRIGAYLSRDPVLLAHMQDPDSDLHGDLCMRVYGYVTDALRTRAKSSLFERMYGGGVAMCAKILNISYSEAEHIFRVQDEMLGTFIERARFLIEKARRDGYAEDIFGSRRYLHDADSDDEFIRHKADKEAVNTPIQGTGGQFGKLAMIILDPWLRSIGGEFARQVHDSIDIWVPQEREQEGKEALEAAMIQAVPQEMRDVVPIFVKVTTGQQL